MLEALIFFCGLVAGVGLSVAAICYLAARWTGRAH
jgi:hypothetical protein